ncbi:MAG: hypothetical protein KKD73_13220 [Proteobacteria bacterium]|nr:hypothetical protein [Pseudomonadota bacterium]MBU1640191.1 hypothetical protein [Pseudomonadota bacterium]
MCVEVKRTCQCGANVASFHLRDNIMAPEVVDRIYCPDCSSEVPENKETMLADNGWLIEYDMDMVRMYAISKLQMDPALVNPGFIFDGGYATWKEMYPGETEDIADERWQIISRKSEDPKRYLREINQWAVSRIQRLKETGWRKAQQA